MMVPRFVMIDLPLPVMGRLMGWQVVEPVVWAHDAIEEIRCDRDGGDARRVRDDIPHPWRDAFPIFPHHRVTPFFLGAVRCACAGAAMPRRGTPRAARS